jgi:hypothetical protein
MSSVPGTTDNVPDFAKGIINTYAASTRSALYFLVIPSLYCAFLVPLLIALFVFSTKQLRYSLVFILIVADVICVILMGCITLYAQVKLLFAQLMTRIPDTRHEDPHPYRPL